MEMQQLRKRNREVGAYLPPYSTRLIEESSICCWDSYWSCFGRAYYDAFVMSSRFFFLSFSSYPEIYCCTDKQREPSKQNKKCRFVPNAALRQYLKYY